MKVHKKLRLKIHWWQPLHQLDAQVAQARQICERHRRGDGCQSVQTMQSSSTVRGELTLPMHRAAAPRLPAPLLQTRLSRASHLSLLGCKGRAVNLQPLRGSICFFCCPKGTCRRRRQTSWCRVNEPNGGCNTCISVWSLREAPGHEMLLGGQEQAMWYRKLSREGRAM